MTAAENVDHLGREIARLVAERQTLREATADAAELERNRLQIGDLQRRFADALIARYAA